MGNNTTTQLVNNIIYTNIVLSDEAKNQQNIINTNIDISTYKASNNILIKTGIDKQLLSIDGSLIFINNKFQSIII